MGNSSRNWKIGGLVALVSTALAAVTQAQLTVNPDGIWLESDSGLSAPGGTVASWTDQANSLVFTPTGVDGAPTVGTTPSGADSVLFTGGALEGSGPYIFHDQRLSAANVDLSLLNSGGPQGTIFIVERPTQPTTYGQTSFGWRDTEAPPSTVLIGRQDLDPGTIVNAHGDPSYAMQAAAPGGFYGDWHMITISRNGNSGFIRVDGGTVTGGTWNPLDSNNLSNGPLTGTAFLGADLYDGQIAAVLAYTTALDGGDILATEGYLNDKYLTPVPEPSQYAMVFSLACVAGVIIMRRRRTVTA